MKSLALAIIAFGTITAAVVIDHPNYASLAGMSHEDLALYERSIKVVGAQPLPPPIKDTSFKLIYDKKHPHHKAGKKDQRGASYLHRLRLTLTLSAGPCPGLNTLASHGVCPCHPLAIHVTDRTSAVPAPQRSGHSCADHRRRPDRF